MRRTIPSVEDGLLYRSEGEDNAIIVGTSAWYDWLEHHTSFLFTDRAGAFTARKSGSESGAPDWEAFRMRAGELHRLWLGPARTLTLALLQAAAQALSGEHAAAEPISVPAAQPAAVQLPVHETAAPAGPPSSLLRTKLYRPRTSSDVIPRAHLLERLNAGLSGTITLLSAPAGFGKTTLLTAWLETIDHPSAWLSLDDDDNELAAFVHALTAALQSVFPDACQATASLLKAPQFPPVDRVATLLINDLADVPEEVILVLDEYQSIHTSQVHRLLELMIEHLPSQLHLVLATRSDPPLPLSRWRAQGRLTELRGADLRFTLEETHAFLNRVVGKDLAQQTAQALEERTEGWIAVLRLAALSLRSTSDGAAFLQRLRHSPDHSVSSYLVEEILAQQAPAVQELLMQASMLEQFCAALCAAIMGNATSQAQVQATLDWVERSNMFLVPQDSRQGWYRFHPLFQRLLQQRLQTRISTEEIVTLHRRASAWYARQGLIQEALEHARASGDGSGAAQLVEAHFLWVFEQEQWVQMERWLRLLPEQQIQSSPILLVARAWIVQARGQLNDFPLVLRAAEQLLATSHSETNEPDDLPSRILRALIAIGWSHFQFFTGQAQASLQSAQSALRWISPGEAHAASYALQYLALSHQVSGQEEVALVELNEALRESSAQLHDTARLLFALSLVYLAAGKLQQMEHTARHLLRLTQQADLALSQYWAHWFLGLVHYEWNQLDTAMYHFSVVIANRHRAHLWAVQNSMYGLALTYQAQGLNSRVKETARALLEAVQGEHNLRDLMTAYAFCGQVALLQDEVEEAEQWLELAGEQAVLGPMIFFEDPPITQAWMLLAKGDEPSVARGQALLTQLLQHVEAIHNTRKTIQVLGLQALAYHLQGRLTEALEVLERALVLGRPAGFLRTFANLPKLSTLLQELRKRRKASQAPDSKLDAYLQRILLAMSPPASQAVSLEELMRQEGIEPLTERELQILHLLDKDLTNKEIARELVVTPGTVKVHTTNVYRKLSVNNRRAAVTLSKALGLLAAHQA
jgi:LuxR family transcriptional regulator, maltose regulon positive regulatory protein